MADSGEGTINGQVLVSFKDYVKKKYGKDGLQEMSGAVGVDVAGIMDDKEYPIHLVNDFMMYLKSKHGVEELYRLGRFSIANIGAKRYFTLLMSPDKLLAKMVESVSKVNNQVKLEARYGDNSAEVSVKGSQMMDVHAEFWKGMMQGVFDLTRTQDGRVETDTGKMAEGRLLYRMKW